MHGPLNIKINNNYVLSKRTAPPHPPKILKYAETHVAPNSKAGNMHYHRHVPEGLGVFPVS